MGRDMRFTFLRSEEVPNIFDYYNRDDINWIYGGHNVSNTVYCTVFTLDELINEIREVLDNKYYDALSEYSKIISIWDYSYSKCNWCLIINE